jgi:predicted membrane channel-forming protein YqfA (hemolysin III family)
MPATAKSLGVTNPYDAEKNYGRKRSLIHLPGFGFHEVFHIYVLGGTICHYLLMLLVFARM